jgi:hypothetical protein
MPFILSAAYSTRRLYWTCSQAVGHVGLSSDQAARERARRLQFVVAVFGPIKLISMISWPVQHSLMKALSVNHT